MFAGCSLIFLLAIAVADTLRNVDPSVVGLSVVVSEMVV
jgi:hypothetical protein